MFDNAKSIAIATAALALPANVALAQTGPPWDWGWWFWWFPVFPLFFVLGILAIFVFVIVRMTGHHGRMSETRAGLDILNERFARGEINKDEYEEKRRLIMKS